MTKILRTLEQQRQLVKAVKSVAGHRKVYMLAELEPSREITGGAWYTEQEFDADFINVLRDTCLTYIIQKKQVTLEQIASHVQRSGVIKEALRHEDYLQVVNTLVYDGEVDLLVSSGASRDLQFPPGTTYFQPAKSRVPESSPFTSIPCGVCPVLLECTEDGVVSPKTCVYYQDWLQF